MKTIHNPQKKSGIANMEEIDLQQSFIKKWLKTKMDEKKFDQAILNAIDNSLGGSMNEDLDEANLLKLLQEIKQGGKIG